MTGLSVQPATATVTATKAGGNVQNIILNDVGLPGASHMLMQDLHSHKIADWLLAWIARNP